MHASICRFHSYCIASQPHIYENVRRVGFEREDPERRAAFARQFRGAADNPAMAEMHAVEIAHRNDGAAGPGRRARVITADAHGAGL